MRLSKKLANLCATLLKISFAVGVCAAASAGAHSFFCRTYSAEADGRAACVMELATGSTLHARNEMAELPMASTTKIMTALIIIEDCDPNEVITVPDEAVGVEGSSIYLRRGEKISVKDLLYGLMLRSGNDSATALAIHHSGGIAEFAEVMNERAARAGAVQTHFSNPSGLPADDHYTTARDLCIIACEAMKNARFKEIVSSRSYAGEYRSFVNKNKMLSLMEGANGIKTGYTMRAGRCLVSSAERDGMDVVCVVLNCPDMYERSQKLIESAFAGYELKEVKGDRVFMCGGLPCSTRNTQTILLKKGSRIRTECVAFECKSRTNAGDVAGRLEIYCENNLIFSADLYSIITRDKIF